MTNKFPGQCTECGARVPAQQGEAYKGDDNKWKVRHAEGTCGQDAAPKAPKVKVDPTTEQAEALELFSTGQSMVIEAGAGTGKTKTLELLAESTDRRGQYVAFNNAIVAEAALKFPANVACNTAHSLAYRSVMTADYKRRMKTPRQPGDVVAKMLNIYPIDLTIGKTERRTLAAGFLAGHVLAAVSNFCRSADREIERKHFSYIEGIDIPTPDGRRTFVNNDEVATRLVSVAKRAWDDIVNPTGSLRFNHDHYLKMWQLQGPRIDVDFILFDEAQDANPVMAAIVEAQTCQVVYVGDSQQAIYEFTGAVNTLAKLDTDHRVFLTQSFRFGDAIAEVANVILGRLEAELRLVGTPTIASQVGLLENENAILCRTNALAVETVLTLQEAGRRPFLVGGGVEVVRFAKAARDLQQSGSTSHEELACFSSWGQVQEYVQNDSQGSELKLLVGLIDKFGIPTILRALESMPAEAKADVVVSTAHKAKGREWDCVRLGSDFPTGDDDKEVSVSEMRLLYVACTRARLHLDLTAIEAFFTAPAEDELPAVVDDDVTRWVDGVEDKA